MAGIVEAIRNAMFGDYEEIDDQDGYRYDDEYEDSEPEMKERETYPDIHVVRPSKRADKNKVVHLADYTEKKTQIVKVAPKKFEDVESYCSMIREDKILIINLEDVDRDLSQRIMDFISGSCCALDAIIERGGKHVYVVAHRDAEIFEGSGKADITRSNIFPWAAIGK